MFVNDIVGHPWSRSQEPFGLESVLALEIAVKVQIPPPGSGPTRRYLSLPPTKQDLTQGQWPEGRFIVGFKGGECRARAETRTLMDYAGHRLT